MTPAYIYALADPRTGDVRYIGKSIKPVARWRRHRKDQTNSRRGRWIRRLAQENLEPLLYILEGPCVNWEEAERRWIAFYLDTEGIVLTNLTEGGDGLRGALDETRTRMSLAGRARFARTGYSGSYKENHLAAMGSAEVRKKISDAGKGRRASPATRAKMSAAHRARWSAPGVREKISASQKARFAASRGQSEATRRKIGAGNAKALKGRKLSQAHREAISAGLRRNPHLTGPKHNAAAREKISTAVRARPVLICNVCGQEVRGGTANLARHQQSQKCSRLTQA